MTCEYCAMNRPVFNLKDCIDCAVRLVEQDGNHSKRLESTLAYIERYQDKHAVKEMAFKRKQKAKKNPPRNEGELF